jgi:hypothetical protein
VIAENEKARQRRAAFQSMRGSIIKQATYIFLSNQTLKRSIQRRPRRQNFSDSPAKPVVRARDAVFATTRWPPLAITAL